MIRTLLCISVHKIAAYFGGVRSFAIVSILLCCCFASASTVAAAKPPESICIAIVDLCDGPVSSALCSSLSDTEGIKATTVKTISEGEDLMLFDSAEAMLIIDPEYDEKILQDQAADLISIKSAPGADSAQLLRETSAGLLIAQRSELRVREALRKDGFTDEDDSAFTAYMREAPTPRMYSVETYGKNGKSVSENNGLLRASYNGVACLTLLLILLTLTRRMSDMHARNVAERMETQRHGKNISLFGDYLALFLVALLISVIAFLFSPEKSVAAVFAWLCYSVCISGICLLISRFNTAGRIDILAPFLAIVTSIFGGCFTDLSVLSDALRIVARCVPQGQMLAASNGLSIFCLLLLSEGIAAFLISMLLNRRRITE